MEHAPQVITEETLGAALPAPAIAQRANACLRSPLFATLTGSRMMPVAYSFADQALAVGGVFLVNVALARTQTKEEYGTFALSYSIFTFLSGLHNAAILEPYTVYGSGRYRDRFSEYLRLIARSHLQACAALAGLLLSSCLLLFWVAPQYVSRALVGLGLTIGILLSGSLLRRVFYLQRQAALAAKASLLFFVTVAGGLCLATRANALGSFSVFLILALGWIAAGAGLGKRLAFGKPKQLFQELEPHYWRKHWKYSQWVLATAFVFQLTSQGYYWLVAGILSVKEVAELKAMYLLIAPVDQIFIALSYVALPVLASHYAARRMGNFSSLWKRFGLAIAAMTALFALLVRILGKTAMHVLYAGKFDGLASLLSVMALFPVVMGIGNSLNNALKAAEKPRLVFYAYLSSGAATFLAGIPLVIHFGLRGAVYGMLFSAATYSGTLATGFYLSLPGRSGTNATGQ